MLPAFVDDLGGTGEVACMHMSLSIARLPFSVLFFGAGLAPVLGCGPKEPACGECTAGSGGTGAIGGAGGTGGVGGMGGAGGAGGAGGTGTAGAGGGTGGAGGEMCTGEPSE